MRTIFKFIIGIVLIGVAWAVLTMFGMNPINVIIWIGKWIYWLIKSVADLLLGSATFRKGITTTPGSLR
jgi:hypothetical protein